MSEYGISAVAVVEPIHPASSSLSESSTNSHEAESEECVLMGNISMADIRFVLQTEGHKSFNKLWMRCGRFVSEALKQKGIENAGKVTERRHA